MAKYQKGQSGNPNGRPPKNRALTDLLEAAGNATIEQNGKRIARKRITASLAWELLTTGKAILPSGDELKLSPQDWLGLYKWIYSHIDGPPKSELDITTGGEQTNKITVEYVDTTPQVTSSAADDQGEPEEV